MSPLVTSECHESPSFTKIAGLKKLKTGGLGDEITGLEITLGVSKKSLQLALI